MNPSIPAFLRLVTAIECLVVFATAAVLFFVPALGREIWAWSPAPFNARYMGAIYFAALVPLVIATWSGRWSPGRVVLWMILTFTGTIMIAMLVSPGGFEWSRPATWAFWFLYLFLPVNSAIYLRRLRTLSLPDVSPLSSGQRSALKAIIAIFGLYGLALLLVPTTAAAFWPWPVDTFHGRIYATVFITPAVGGMVLLARGTPDEFRSVAATLVTLGVLAIAGLVWTSATVPPARKVDFAAAGTLGFLALNVFAVAAGAWLAAVCGRR